MTTVCREWLDAASLAEIRDRDRAAGASPRVTVLPPSCGHDPADCPPLPDHDLHPTTLAADPVSACAMHLRQEAS